MIWVERRPGALWAVGRAINPRNRAVPGVRLKVSAEEGVNEDVKAFDEDELLKPLERWFFGHTAQ